jgi:hypothetical protein
MGVVAITALDISVIQAIGRSQGDRLFSGADHLLLLDALPMANVLAISVLTGMHRLRSRSFLLDFEATRSSSSGIIEFLKARFLQVFGPEADGPVERFAHLLDEPDAFELENPGLGAALAIAQGAQVNLLPDLPV